MSGKIDIVEMSSSKKRRNRRKTQRVKIVKQGNQALQRMGVKIPRKKGSKNQVRRQRRIGGAMNVGGGIDRFPRGTYQVQSNNVRPTKGRTENGMEYIGEVVANSTGFSVVKSLPCNPGQSSTFPRLSKIAQLYEEYQFLKLEFIYKPEVAQFADLGKVGKIILNADYDASDPPPSLKQQMEDTDPCADGMPYEEICLVLNPKYLHKNSDAKYVRPGGLPGNTDIKTYDCANFNLATSALFANTGGLGELWVRYSCKLSVPVLESVSIAPMNFSVSLNQSTAPEAITTSAVSQNVLFGTSVVNGTSLVNTAGSIVIPTGNYLIDVNVFEVSLGAITGNITLDLQKNGSSVFTTVPNVETLSNNGEIGFSWYVTSNGTDAFTFPVNVTFSAGTAHVSGNLRVTAI